MTMRLLVLFLVFTSTLGSDEKGLAFLEEKKKDPDVVALPSGLLYKVLKPGDGLYHPGPSTPCSCHYAGTLIDGTEFDSSYGRGSPTTFAPNQVIKGWTEAMQLMVEGDKFELYIPSELAYGSQGSPPKIPGDSVLVFQMEILEILPGGEKIPKLTCDITNAKETCDSDEQAYLTKASQSYDAAKVTAQLERLQRLLASHKIEPNMSEERAMQSRRRVHILKQLQKKAATGGDEEEL